MGQLLETVVSRMKAEEPELRRRGIRHLSVFGSVARGDEGPKSDVDLAIEIEPGRRFSLITLEGTRRHLETLLGVPVDLGTVRSLRDHVRPAFERDRVDVF